MFLTTLQCLFCTYSIQTGCDLSLNKAPLGKNHYCSLCPVVEPRERYTHLATVPSANVTKARRSCCEAEEFSELQVTSGSQNPLTWYDKALVHLAGCFSFYSMEIKSSRGLIASLGGMKCILRHSPPPCEILKKYYLSHPVPEQHLL